MEKIYKDKRVSYFKDDLWTNTIALRSLVMTPLYVERYRGARLDHTVSSHNFWEYSVHISGKGILVSDQTLQIIPDIIHLVPPGMSHRESSEQELDSIWVGFQSDLPGVSRDKILSLKSPEMIRRFIEYWSFASRNFGPIGPELDGQLLNITGYFFRKLKSNRMQTPMQQAVDFFNENYQEPVSMVDVAEQLNCSEGHFYRQFKDFTGETPIRFLNNIRLKKASFYLSHSNLPVKQVALICGFFDPYYFSRVFSRNIGCSPSLYRANYRSG